MPFDYLFRQVEGQGHTLRSNDKKVILAMASIFMHGFQNNVAQFI